MICLVQNENLFGRERKKTGKEEKRGSDLIFFRRLLFLSFVSLFPSFFPTKFVRMREKEDQV